MANSLEKAIIEQGSNGKCDMTAHKKDDDLKKLTISLAALKTSPPGGECLKERKLERPNDIDMTTVEGEVKDASRKIRSKVKSDDQKVEDKDYKSMKGRLETLALVKAVGNELAGIVCNSLFDEKQFLSYINNEAENYRKKYEKLKYVLKSKYADDFYIEFAEACYFCARQTEGIERKRFIIEGSLAASKSHDKNKNNAVAKKWMVILGLEQMNYLPYESRNDVFYRLESLLTYANEARPDDYVTRHFYARLCVNFQNYIGSITAYYYKIFQMIFLETRKELPPFLQMENLYYAFICSAFTDDFTEVNALLPLPPNVVVYDRREAEYFHSLVEMMRYRNEC